MTGFMGGIKSQWLREAEDLWTAMKKLWAIVFLRRGKATFDASTFVLVIMCKFIQTAQMRPLVYKSPACEVD